MQLHEARTGDERSPGIMSFRRGQDYYASRKRKAADAATGFLAFFPLYSIVVLVLGAVLRIPYAATMGSGTMDEMPLLLRIRADQIGAFFLCAALAALSWRYGRKWLAIGMIAAIVLSPVLLIMFAFGIYGLALWLG